MKRQPLHSTADVVRMFGFASTESFHMTRYRGDFPAPDVVLHGRMYWYKATLRQESARREAMNLVSGRGGHCKTIVTDATPVLRYAVGRPRDCEYTDER
jgi:hypothetical protein